MASFDSTSSTDGQAGEPAGASSAPPDEITPEAITAPRSSAEAVAAPAKSAASNLPSALEPELRRIIDTAVARVAAIELEAIREARELTQRSENEARDALKFALDRAFNLINSLELLASTVNGMAEALKVELDDAITALRNVPEPESELSIELAGLQPEPVAAEPVAAEPEPAEPEPEPAEPEPQPEPAAVEPEPQPPAEPRVRLSPIVRPAEPSEGSGAAEPDAAEREPERELVAVGAPEAPTKHKSQPPHSRKGRVRRFFTR